MGQGGFQELNRDAMLCGVSGKRARRPGRTAWPATAPLTPAKRPREQDDSGKENEETSNAQLMTPPDVCHYEDDILGLTGVRVRTKGQLKLAVYVNNGLLTIHVLQARGLNAKNCASCDSYVELSLLPADGDKTHCQTDVVYSATNPSFDEKFSFEVMEEDQKKRLMVAMRSKDSKKNCTQLLGCMSFGVKHLLTRKKNVNGWYYLLSEDVGRRKHLQAARRQMLKEKVSTSGSIPEVNKSLHGLDTVTIVIKRGRQGYGFTVLGCSPVSVGKVEDGSHADTAGLCKADSIVRINGQNVSRSSADSVAKIVKNSLKQIVLDVVRNQRPHTTSSSIKTESMYSATSSQIEGATGMSACYDFLPPPPYPSSASERSFSIPRTPSSKRGNKENSLPNKQRKVHKENSLLSQKASPWTPKSSSSDQVPWQPKTKTDSCVLSPWQPEFDTYDELPWEHNSEIYDELPWKPFECDLDTAHLEDEPSYLSMDEDITSTTCDQFAESDCTANYAHTTLPELTVTFHDLTCQEQARQTAIRELVEGEEEFIRQMQYGIQRYSRPLRHCILTPQEHRTLFQNVEKLVAISEYHLRQLSENSLAYADRAGDTDRYINTAGIIYQPKISLLCEAYEQYCSGLEAALRVLHDLQLYEDFYEFISTPLPEGNEPTIDEFLKRPSEHLNNIMLVLRSVLTHTTAEHEDTTELRNIVDALSKSCNKINKRQNTSSTESNKSTHSTGSITSRSSTQSRSSGNSTTSTASVDPELMEIQSRLVFPAHIQTFQVATPSRHVIYTGELLKVDGCKWTRVFAVLLSDLLLLTRLDGDSLVVMDNPLLLSDIMSADFNCSHPCEFTLEAESRSSSATSWQPRFLLLRTPSMDQKCTWKSLLEQRLSSFRSHRELMTCRARDLMM